MRPILHTLLLLFLTLIISCQKIALFPPNAEKITINGTVSDENNNLLDSVEIKLYESSILYSEFCIGGKYSKNGILKFEFTPKEGMWNYRLRFFKKGYRNEEYKVVGSKGFQKCDIIMEKAVE